MIEENTSGCLRAGWLFRTALFFCLLIGVYFTLVTTAPLWPRGRLDEHLKEASVLLNKEGLYYMPFGQMPTMDNFTEALMLNITGTLDLENPVRAAMRMNIAYVPDDTDTPLRDFENFVEGRATEKRSYARYWHGYTVILRPLLSVMAFRDVRKFSFCCLMALFTAATILLSRRLGGVTALGFGLAMTLGGFPLLAFGMTFVSDFATALALMCAILYWNIKDEENLVRLFLLAGSLTAFLDILTAPLVTFTLPLLSWLLLDLKRQIRWDRRRVKSILLLGVVWSAGYILAWAAKWILADLVLGEGIVRDAVNQILVRTGSAEGMTFFDRLFAVVLNIYPILPFSVTITGGKGIGGRILTAIYQIRDTETLTWPDKLILMIKEVSSLLPSFVLWGLIVTVLILAVYLIIIVSPAANKKKSQPVGALGYFSLAFLFLIPYFWYFVTANHATIHYWFTFRNQIPSVWLFLILPHIMKKKSTE
jgi:hypothetical protein